MGYIYRITNRINNTIYIGQTRGSVHRRWLDHCKSARNQLDKDYFLPLHNAIRKYGEDNFQVEVIEDCENDILNDREIYYISKYNSYKNGYNATLGGLGQTKYDYCEIVEYYLNHNNSLLETCKHFHLYDQVVYQALNSYHIDYKNIPKKAQKNKPFKKRILLIEKNIIFNSMADIDSYFNKVAHPNVRRCLNGITKKAYGYHWRELEENEIIENGVIYDIHNL